MLAATDWQRAAGFQLEGFAWWEAVITGAPPEVFLPILPSDGWRVLPADLQVYPPIWRAGGRLANTMRPASGHRDHVTHHVTSHVTHWGQWKYASRSWHAVSNHRRQLKLMYWSKISGRGPKHCSGSKFQCRPRPAKDTISHCYLSLSTIFSPSCTPLLLTCASLPPPHGHNAQDWAGSITGR